MKAEKRKEHWEHIYATKQPCDVSWTQENPAISLEFIHSFNLSKESSIIDVGGGDSKLVDRLLDEGFEDITVLDISAHAIKRTKDRLGVKARKVKWVVSDITNFCTEKTFDLWHDRATFHFLTTPREIQLYLSTAKTCINEKGFLTVGTFSETGPEKCSGLEIKQYSEKTLQNQLKNGFTKIKCVAEDHKTPFDTLQNFLFCSFKRRPN